MIFKILLFLLAFFFGTLYGVRDCKKTFGIPKKAKPEDVTILMNVEEASAPFTVEGDVNGVE